MEKLNELEKWCQEVVKYWPAVTKLESFNHRLVRDVAEAFRALEQRAEAAEAKIALRGADYIRYECRDCGHESLKYTTHCKNCGRTDIAQEELFTRPAPAADLADLVPDAIGIHDMDPQSKDVEVVTAIAQCEGWNACRAAVLRNIEEAK